MVPLAKAANKTGTKEEVSEIKDFLILVTILLQTYMAVIWLYYIAPINFCSTPFTSLVHSILMVFKNTWHKTTAIYKYDSMMIR